MDSESTQTRHILTLTGIKNPDNRTEIAQALSKIGSLPFDRVLRRLDSLPWVLTRQAPRGKAVKLVRILEHLGVEIAADPPLLDNAPQESSLPRKIEGPSELTRDTSLRELPKTEFPSPARMQSSPVPLSPGLSQKTEAPAVPEKIDPGIGSIPLEGMLDPAFRIEPTTSRGSAVIQISRLVIYGIMRCLAPIFDRSFMLIKAHFWTLGGISSVSCLFSIILSLLVAVGASLGGTLTSILSQLPMVIVVIGALVFLPAFVVIAVAAFMLPYMATIYAASRIHLGQDVSIAEAYRAVWPKFGKYFLTQSLFSLILIGITIPTFFIVVLLVTFVSAGLSDTQVPGLFVVIVLSPAFLFLGIILAPLAYCVPMWFLIGEVVILENYSGSEALRRSWRLVSGRVLHSWYTSYYLLVSSLLFFMILLYLAIHFLFQGPFLLLVHLLPELKWITAYLSEITGYIGGWVAGIPYTVVSVVFYYAIRNRREGLDLMLQAGIADTENTEGASVLSLPSSSTPEPGVTVLADGSR